LNTQATKRWTVNVVSERHLPLALFCDGRPLPPNPPTIADSISPIQYLLISVASCFALSCRAVLSRRKLSDNSFEVVVIGEKQLAPVENWLSQISVVAIFGSGITESDAILITDQAKPMCTVANTIFESPNILYTSRAVKGSVPDRMNPRRNIQPTKTPAIIAPRQRRRKRIAARSPAHVATQSIQLPAQRLLRDEATAPFQPVEIE
jgi:uncharacterized OsmC-like protein